MTGSKFPLTVKHSHARVKIYHKSARYPFYRIAYRAEGGRVVRSFKTYGEAKHEAKRVAKQIAAGKESVARLSVRNALSYKFAVEKLAELCADLNARKVDFNAPDFTLSLEDAITEFAEAKRALGPSRLSLEVRLRGTCDRARRHNPLSHHGPACSAHVRGFPRKCPQN